MRAAFLGRFQPFHQGHQKVIENYREKYEKIDIVIGSAEKYRTEENPLTAQEREEIIRTCHPEIEVKKLEDDEKTEEGNKRWVNTLREKIEADTVISQNDLVRRLVNEHTDMEIEEQQLHNEDIYSGTEIRRRIRSGEEWRYLVPECAREKIEDYAEVIKKTGTQYEFEPGWKKENAYHGTADN